MGIETPLKPQLRHHLCHCRRSPLRSARPTTQARQKDCSGCGSPDIIGGTMSMLSWLLTECFFVVLHGQSTPFFFSCRHASIVNPYDRIYITVNCIAQVFYIWGKSVRAAPTSLESNRVMVLRVSDRPNPLFGTRFQAFFFCLIQIIQQ